MIFHGADDEFGEKTVSVLLDGEESEIVFIDHPSSEMSVSFFFLRFFPLIYFFCVCLGCYNNRSLCIDFLNKYKNELRRRCKRNQWQSHPIKRRMKKKTY